MVKYVFVFGILLEFISFFSIAQNGMDAYPTGGRSIGMGNANVTLADGWSMFNNIGGLGRIEQTQAVFGYDHRLNMNELTTLAAGLALVQRWGNLGLNVSHYGGTLFNQQNIGIGFSNTLGITSFGLKLNYLQTNIEGFGRSGSPIIEFGGIAELTPQLFFGAHIYNLSRSKLSKLSEEYLPMTIKAGLSYRPSEFLMLNMEAEKEILLEPIFKAGLEYNLKNRIWGRTGFNTQPNNLFFGLGFKPRRYHIDYAMGQNYRLGFTHHFSFNLLFNE
ncbi:PorV/PorQ family protein [Anditalea andensis]|uniref:PorV/PorQ family protein n=1 Tax=Anditalea andensis TaxID=1048983 RepID=A0A074KVR4_9BACT|nr:hypothetical protein [Anditalea andensis]KEO72355.1 hypothetical protein EL17_16545 [Anditalea andensis]